MSRGFATELGFYAPANKASHGRRARLVLVSLLIMCHVLKMLFHGFTAADVWLLIIELMVLALIAYEVVSNVRHKRRMARRIAELFPFVERGQRLQTSIPEQSTYMSGEDADALERWVENFKAWDSETQTLLSGKSSRAASVFMHVVDASKTDRARWDRNGRVHYLSGEVGNTYQLLQVKLDNLQRIMENPDAYF